MFHLNNASLGAVVMDEDPACAIAIQATLMEFDVGTVALNTGDVITLNILPDGGEPVRRD